MRTRAGWHQILCLHGFITCGQTANRIQEYRIVTQPPDSIHLNKQRMDFERTNRGTVGKISSVTARPRRTCVSRCEDQVSKEYLPVPILRKWAKTQPTEIASGFFSRVNNQQEDCINPKVRSFKNQLALLFWGGVLYEYHSYCNGIMLLLVMARWRIRHRSRPLKSSQLNS